MNNNNNKKTTAEVPVNSTSQYDVSFPRLGTLDHDLSVVTLTDLVYDLLQAVVKLINQMDWIEAYTYIY